ncbi:hypothetical protein M9Y10_014281 [Tritrichomonas musculus]|uniref:Ubiquitin-like domain-containing protein n=1 Tax=Tritrichomonas musculus TaxID=1915356 RepID=A0ABR2KZA1_9EUKA
MISNYRTQDDDFVVILQVKDFINRTFFSITTHLTNTALDLKHEVESERDNLSAQNMRLVFSGHLLNDYFTLISQGIKNGSTLYLISEKPQHNAKDEFKNDSVCSSKPNESKSSTSLLHIFQVSRSCVRARHVKLSLNNAIISLDQAFSSNTIYIFSGEILDKTRSFEYYNITNESTIVLLPIDYSNSDPSIMEKWLKLTNDKENFQSLVDSNTKKSCTRENSRLIDLKYNNLELNRKQFLSFYNEQVKKFNDF